MILNVVKLTKAHIVDDFSVCLRCYPDPLLSSARPVILMTQTIRTSTSILLKFDTFIALLNIWKVPNRNAPDRD